MSQDSGKPAETEHEGSERTTRSFASEEETELGIGQETEAAIGYLFSIFGGIFLWVVEDHNDFVRFHAMQNMALSLVYLAIYVAFRFVLSILAALIGVGLIFSWIGLLVQLAIFLVVVFMIWQASQGKRYKLPILGDFAEDQLE